MTPRDPDGDRPREPRSPLAFAGLGFEILAPILVGIYGGYLLDRWLDTRPWFIATGLLVGIVVSFVSFFFRVWPTRRGGEGNGS